MFTILFTWNFFSFFPGYKFIYMDQYHPKSRELNIIYIGTHYMKKKKKKKTNRNPKWVKILKHQTSKGEVIVTEEGFDVD